MTRLSEELDHLRETFLLVVRSPYRRLGWIALATLFALIYSLLLPFDFTQQIAFSNWSYVGPYIVVWSIILGTAMGLVLVIQITAMREVISAGSTSLTGLAFVASLVPSFLCCTPIVPTLLAFAGFSSLGLYTATGSIQHFFATQQTLFLAASLVILLGSIWWSSSRLCRARCRLPKDATLTTYSPTAQTDVTEV